MPDRKDMLNRESFVEKLINIVEHMSENKKGFMFGIDGDWGSGKSFVLDLFEKSIEQEQLEETNDNKYFVFHYDCWKYDYYEEPVIAIISAMLKKVDDAISLFGEKAESVKKKSWEKAKELLSEMASDIVKNKIGIDLVGIFEDIVDDAKNSIDKKYDFDKLYSFNKVLDEIRKKMKKIAELKTMVIVIDELDRCLPTYSIKILERLHHVFQGLENVIVILAIDKKQLDKSIQNIYGSIDADRYLRKFMTFKLTLDNGSCEKYSDMFKEYFSKFRFAAGEINQLNSFFKDIMQGLDMRTIERIFNKASIVHLIIVDEQLDASLLGYEILFQTVALKMKTYDIEWINEIGYTHLKDIASEIGQEYYKMLQKYIDSEITKNNAYDGPRKQYISTCNDSLLGKVFFLLAKSFESIHEAVCGPYYYPQSHMLQKELDVVKEFMELIKIVDSD